MAGGPGAPERADHLPVAPLPGRSRPFPRSDVRPGARGLLPGEARRAMPGGQYRPVGNDVDNLGRTRSVPVDCGGQACALPARSLYGGGRSRDDAIHRLWTRDCMRALLRLLGWAVRPGRRGVTGRGCPQAGWRQAGNQGPGCPWGRRLIPRRVAAVAGFQVRNVEIGTTADKGVGVIEVVRRGQQVGMGPDRVPAVDSRGPRSARARWLPPRAAGAAAAPGRPGSRTSARPGPPLARRRLIASARAPAWGSRSEDAASTTVATHPSTRASTVSSRASAAFCCSVSSGWNSAAPDSASFRASGLAGSICGMASRSALASTVIPRA